MTQDTQHNSDEQSELLTEVSQLVLESAFMRYLALRSEEDQASFEVFVTAHGQDDGFIDTLLATYPDFRPILEAETRALLGTKK